MSANRLAAAAAAKINATLQAKKGIQHVNVPPIKSSGSGADGRTGGATINTEMYVADGDYIKDIEINDMRNRYVVTKGSTQQMVNIFMATILAGHDYGWQVSRAALPSSLPHRTYLKHVLCVAIVLLTRRA